MYYTVYKITNKVNDKYYIGMHQTKNLNDAYMGSGKLIQDAIKKHGRDNFIKEILFVFDNEDEMKAKEAELVVISEQTYNICEGGKGGFGYINQTNIPKFKGKKHTAESIDKMLETRRERGIPNPLATAPAWNKGLKMSEEYKRQRSNPRKKRV